MAGKETCAGARYADCEGAIAERSRKTYCSTEAGKTQYGERVVVVFCVREQRRRGETRAERRVERGGGAQHGEVEGDASTKVECRAPVAGMTFAKRVQGSSDSNRSDGTGTSEIHSSEKALIAVIEMTSSTTWREDVTAN